MNHNGSEVLGEVRQAGVAPVLPVTPVVQVFYGIKIRSGDLTDEQRSA